MGAGKQRVLVIFGFLLLLAGILISHYLWGPGASEPRYDQYDQSNRLEKIREGLVDGN